jgi:hypothetical protein
MTIVRIAHAEPRPGKLGNGGFQTRGHLVVLADDAGHRAVPVRLRGEPGADDLAQLVERPAGETGAAYAPEDLTARLLHAAGASVTGVDIEVTGSNADELSPQAAVARIGLGGPAGSREVAAGLGLAMAAATDAPVRLASDVQDRVAVPAPGDDLLGPLLDHVPPYAQVRPGQGPAGWPLATLPGKRPRFEPRNLDFADGLDRWDLDLSTRREADSADYPAAADGDSAVVSSAVPRPAGSAALVQSIFADDYRGAVVTFRGEFRTRDEAAGTDTGRTGAANRAGLFLRIVRGRNVRQPLTERAAVNDPDNHIVTLSGDHDHGWASHQVTARVPDDANTVLFGVFLAGHGRIELRHAELTTAPARSAGDQWGG